MITRLLRIISIATAAFMVAGVELGFAHFGSSQGSALDVATLTLGLAADPAATTTDGCATVTVAWTKATGADSYDVEVRRDLGLWTVLVAGAGDVASVTDSTSGGSTQVEYRITPLHVGSGWSGPTSTTASLACA